jgi:ribonuclease HI
MNFSKSPGVTFPDLNGYPPGTSWSMDATGESITLPPIYNPSSGSCLRDLSIENLIERRSPFSHVCYGVYADGEKRRINESSVLVFTDGACPNNVRPDAAGGIGIYFGPNSLHNISQRLPGSEIPTNQRAEIQAAVTALKILKKELDTVFSMHKIVIGTDSEYVVKAMSEYVFSGRRITGILQKGRRLPIETCWRCWMC